MYSYKGVELRLDDARCIEWGFEVENNLYSNSVKCLIYIVCCSARVKRVKNF